MPACGRDGEVVVAVASPDLDNDRMAGRLVLFKNGEATDFTLGPRDSEPVISPDRRLVVFLRAAEKGPKQLFAMPLGGGEPRKLTEHLLGAGRVVFAPDGQWIAYCAPVPEPGRYGADDKIRAEAEPPRRIDRLGYRLDGDDFLLDKLQQIFLLDLDRAAAEPRQLTNEPSGVADPVFAGDGRLLYVRPTGVDALTEEIAALDVTDPDSAGTPRLGETLVTATGSATGLTVDGETVYYLGAAFTGRDASGRTTGLWSAPLAGGGPRRLTDEDTVDIDTGAGPPLPAGGVVLVAVLDRGRVSLGAVPSNGTGVVLGELPIVLGGQRIVRSFTGRDRSVVAVIADASSAGEVVTVELAADGVARSETLLSDFSADLRLAGVLPVEELTATASDGYPVHGFLVLPTGPGPHPVLLNVHGGPHAAYGPAFFDEAQVYAAAGYAVVLGNPRGSAGYGQEHARAVLGELGVVDVDDVLALLDAALRRPECDENRVGVMGGSYGGFMTSWLLAHTTGRFVAGISERAVNAWDSFAGSSDIGYYFAGIYVGEDRETLWAKSPLAYADDIDVPLLIIHSEHDWRCPVEQAQRLFVSLKRRGAPVEMLLFPGEGHELTRSGRPRHRQQRFAAILAWWERYLPVVSGPESGS
jgi:dipeptidyl aminopeptidase/acylaminoacyl peptidase